MAASSKNQTTRQKLANLKAFVWKHEDMWTSMGAHERRSTPIGQALVRTLRHLDQWYPTFQDRVYRATYIKEPYDQSIEEILIEPTTKNLAATRAFAASLGLPLPPLPPIPRNRTTVSGDTMSRPPTNFLACCRACLTEEGELLVTCELRNGRRLERTIQLRPIAERIKQMIRHYHANVLHGNMEEETISGIGDWYHSAVSAAARIANSKAVASMWSEVQKHHGAIELGLTVVPGGAPVAMAMRTGFTVHAMVAKAKDGDPVAAADVASIVALADKGDPKAQQVTSMMKSMNNMMNIKNAKVDATLVVGKKHKHKKRHNRGSNRNRSMRSRDEQPDYPQEDQGYGGNAPPAPSSNDYGYADPGYDEDMRELAADDVASGWLFNRPYRLLAITPGLALRGFYNLGLAV